jgi:deoxyribodipyrimidine photo-lyase
MNNHLVWFRNDLRVRDNNVLRKAREGADCLIAVYCFDPRQFEDSKYGFKKTEKYRARFLLETVRNLKSSLERLHIPLLVYLARPEEVIPKVVKDYEINCIYFQKEWTTEECDVNDSLKVSLAVNVQLVELYDQFLYPPEDVPFSSFKEIPQVFTAFRKKVEKFAQVPEQNPVIEAMERDNLFDNPTAIPSLHQLGLEEFKTDPRSAFPFSGGERQAWTHLENYIWTGQYIKSYKETRNGLVGVSYSSKLSPWLANGSISARSIFWQVRKFEREVKKNSSTYWLIFELIWRDYFKYVSLKEGDKIFRLGGILQNEYDWKNDERSFKRWRDGQTPYSFVNANMKELAHTGWMSNRGRQNVASYWAKELQQDWRIGAAYFESLLIDYDVHSNWGNWMYNSGVGNDPRDRKFNIQLQAKRYDPDKAFQNLWNL